jgi:hypothetical protein
MRKVNTILSVLLIVIFMIHGIMGSFMLLGVGASAGKILAWIGVAILAAHMVIGVLLTVQTFKASKAGGKSYLKQNELFWTRRASGLAILIMMFFHIGQTDCTAFIDRSTVSPYFREHTPTAGFYGSYQL